MKTSSPDVHLLESFGRLRRALNLHFSQALRPLGLGAKQAALMRLLAKQGTASLAELSRATLTDPAATTRVVNVLLKRGLVRQKKHPTDKRRWELALTSPGARQAEQVQEVYGGLARDASGALTRAEREEFLRILVKLTGFFAPECGKKTNRPKPGKMNKEKPQ